MRLILPFLNPVFNKKMLCELLKFSESERNIFSAFWCEEFWTEMLYFFLFQIPIPLQTTHMVLKCLFGLKRTVRLNKLSASLTL